VFADFRVVLDACVLANFAVADVFLRFAEEPRLFLPRWSEEILTETWRTHVKDLGWPERLAGAFDQVLREHFPEALVTGYDWLIDHCQNDPKDRHVLACAIQAKAEVITTFNVRDFPAESLLPWNIVAMHPQDQLLSLYGLYQPLALFKLTQIATEKNIGFEDYLIALGGSSPPSAVIFWKKSDKSNIEAKNAPCGLWQNKPQGFPPKPKVSDRGPWPDAVGKPSLRTRPVGQPARVAFLTGSVPDGSWQKCHDKPIFRHTLRSRERGRKLYAANACCTRIRACRWQANARLEAREANHEPPASSPVAR
jgi:hypothetical protein